MQLRAFIMNTIPRLGLLVALSMTALSGCYAGTYSTVPVTSAEVETGDDYQPAYYDGYVVYYDDIGRPYYYNNGIQVWISPGSPYYAGYVHHWHMYGGPRYHAWYVNHGYRYHSYRSSPGYHSYHGYRGAPARGHRR
jgi:hypothetical protein